MIDVNLLRKTLRRIGASRRPSRLEETPRFDAAKHCACPSCHSEQCIVLDSRRRKREQERRRVMLCQGCGTRYVSWEPLDGGARRVEIVERPPAGAP